MCFAASLSWKLIDFVTTVEEGTRAPLSYTLRYAAPEVLQAVMQGKQDVVRDPAMDMWSVGVVIYEIYTGKRLFDPELSNQAVAALLASKEELVLEGLVNVEENASRLIRKLLTKNPKQRWDATKCLTAKVFRSMDDTTKMSSSSTAVAASLRNISSKVDRILDVSLVTLKDMQTGDLLAEIELWEREPKLQRCILSQHDQAGDVFNLVHDRTYIVVVNVFRESSSQVNPVSQVRVVVVVLHAPLCRSPPSLSFCLQVCVR